MDTLPCEQQGIDPSACERVQECLSLLETAARFPGFVQELNNADYKSLMLLLGERTTKPRESWL
jgi:hypothetical protein